MAYYMGILKRKMSKSNREYFSGKCGGVPLWGFWGKKNQDDLHLFLDTRKVNFLAGQNKPAAPIAVPDILPPEELDEEKQE